MIISIINYLIFIMMKLTQSGSLWHASSGGTGTLVKSITELYGDIQVILNRTQISAGGEWSVLVVSLHVR